VRDLSAKEQDLLFRAVTKPALQPFLFRKIKGLHWFFPLLEKGFFSPENNPAPIPAKEEGYVTIAAWPVTDYLVATSEELSAPANRDFAVRFLQLIRDVTKYAQTHNFSNQWTWLQLAKIIKRIPIDLISIEDINLVDYWLDDPYYTRNLIAEELGENWLFELLESQDERSSAIVLRVLEALYRVKFDKDGGEAFLRSDPWHAEKITKKVAALSGRSIGLDVVSLFERNLVLVLEKTGRDRYTYIWRNAIEDRDDERRREDVYGVLIAAYRDSLLGFTARSPQEASSYIASLFDRQYETLKRVVIYVINQEYEVLEKLLDLVLSGDYFTDGFRHEVWHLLHDRYEKFSAALKQKVAEIIESLEVKDQEETINEQATAFTRSLWLSAIKDYGAKELGSYMRCIEVTKRHPEHPDFPGYVETRWVEIESPLPLESLLPLSIVDLVKRLNSCTIKAYRGGLARAFKEAVKVKALEYHENMHEFVGLDLEYVQSIIDGFRELWVEKKELPWLGVWSHLLGFCNDVISGELFLSETPTDEGSGPTADRTEIVRSIARLIEDGTRSDENAFDASLLPLAKTILITLLGREKGDQFKEDDDAVVVTMNSTRGKCLNALINHSLRSCRIADKEGKEHAPTWEEYEGIYDMELRRGQQGEYEFATLVTSCIPNFLYMSAIWVYANLSTIFDQSNYQKWLCAMQGYAYVGAVDSKVYDHLRTYGDYLKTLDDKSLRDRIGEKVVKDITLSYLNNHELLEDEKSLIAILLRRRKFEELSHIVWFIWTLRGSKGMDLHGKLMGLWPKMIDLIDSGSKEGRELASSLCRWAEVIESIDSASEEWLTKIAPFAEVGHSSDSLLQGLSVLSEKQPLEAQRVWLRMLDSYSYDFPERAIRKIFENLVKLGEEGKRKALEIVDAYIQHGLGRPREWLSEIISSYKEHKT